MKRKEDRARALAETRWPMNDREVRGVALDQRAYGQKGPSGGGLPKKSTVVLATLDRAEDLEKGCITTMPTLPRSAASGRQKGSHKRSRDGCGPARLTL